MYHLVENSWDWSRLWLSYFDGESTMQHATILSSMTSYVFVMGRHQYYSYLWCLIRLSFFLSQLCLHLSRFSILSSCLSTTWSTRPCRFWPWGPSTRTWTRECPSSLPSFTLRAKGIYFSRGKSSPSRRFTGSWRHSCCSASPWVMKAAASHPLVLRVIRHALFSSHTSPSTSSLSASHHLASLVVENFACSTLIRIHFHCMTVSLFRSPNFFF